MPVQKRGFAFRYFDKILCGVVALGLIVGIGYGLMRNAGFAERVNPQQIARDIEELRRRQGGDLPSVAEPQLEEQILGRLENVDQPRPVRDMMLPPLPYAYPEQRVPPEVEFELEFSAPLAPGSVTVEGNEFALEVLEHPVAGDYRRVKVASKRWEEQASVVGKAGEVKHIYPVVIDSAVGKTPYPPVDLRVLNRREQVRLSFRHDSRVEQEGVEIRNYEVWRRDWSDPTAEYKLVAAVAPTAEAEGVGQRRRSPQRATGDVPEGLEGVLPPEMLREMQGRTQPSRRREQPTRGEEEQAQQPTERAVVWVDQEVEPGRRYGYKVRTVGKNTFPTEGQFTEPLTAEVFPNLDFKFTLPGMDSVRVEVRKEFDDGRVRGQSFWVAVGEEIGRSVRDRRTDTTRDFSTGYTLIDFHSRATVPDSGLPSSRIICIDQDGVLRERYRNETRLNALWD
ncbi:MAG: hypothetical protein R6X33_07735 [Candidatus Brocadiia bacterium]